MKLLDQTEVLIQYEDLKNHRFKKPQKPTQDRSKEVHLSDILKYLYFGSLPSVLDKKDVQKKMQEASDDLESAFDPSVIPLKMILGMAFESFIVGFYRNLVWQPPELKKDGISGSPDGWTPQLVEFKLTWKSCRDRLGEKILQESLWIWQVKGYLAMALREEKSLILHDELVATLHVCWVNGDYSHPYQPRYTKSLIEFTEEELESFWNRAILPNKERAMKWKLEQERKSND